MAKNLNSQDDTIVAVSTPIGEGGIGIIRMSGPSALGIADSIFVSKDGARPSKFKTYTTHYGHVVTCSEGRRTTPRPRSGQAEEGRLVGKDGGRLLIRRRKKKANVIDEALLTVMRAPGSYTKEDIVEINCHGGIQALKRTLDLCLKRGARLAEPGEFTKRAFLNGRLDLAQAEAVLDVISAKTEASLKAAVAQLDGEISRSVGEILDRIVEIASEIEASIDFPDEELDLKERKALIVKAASAAAEMKALADSYYEGAILREGVLAIICGKPNVGKSSLMNLLLKRDRVIVSPIPGTTRDAVEEAINLKGLPIRLVDTAGMTASGGILEKEAVERSKKYLGMADIAVLVIDASDKLDHEDFEIIKLLEGKKKVVVANKIDLARRTGRVQLRKIFPKDTIVEISVEKRKNIGLLEKAIAKAVWRGGFSQQEAAVITSARHKELLDKALANMISVIGALKDDFSPELAAIDLKEAAFNLGLIIGRSVADDVLERIFERFCIGK